MVNYDRVEVRWNMGKKIPSFEDLGLNESDSRDRALYLMWESCQYRNERINTKLWIVVLVLIVALIGTNVGWLYYESQWQYVQTETSIEATQDGENNIINGGDYYGAESKDN